MTDSAERPLPKPSELHESVFSLLFAEAVRHSYQKAQDIGEIEAKLAALGYEVGWRTLELVASRDKEKREVRIIDSLRHVTSTCWVSLFGKQADALEKSSERPDTFLISEREPLPSRYASIPSDLGSLTLAAFNAGIIQGLESAQGFDCQVTAHATQDKSGAPKVVYVVRFDSSVMEREARMARS